MTKKQFLKKNKRGILSILRKTGITCKNDIERLNQIELNPHLRAWAIREGVDLDV